MSRISKSYYDEFKTSGNSKYEKIHELFLQILYFILEGIGILKCNCKKKHCLNELSAMVLNNLPNQYNMINPLYMLSLEACKQVGLDVGSQSKKNKASKQVRFNESGSLDVLTTVATKRKMPQEDHSEHSPKRCKNK
jgi:hypothetical protein